MKPIRRLYGPYVTRSNPAHPRRFVIRHYGDGTRETTSYARHLMEVTLGRTLGADEHVDHIDGNQMNDDPGNLQVLSPAENNAKGRRVETVTVACPVCGGSVVKRARDVRHNRRQGKAGPFCGRVCARRYQLNRDRYPNLAEETCSNHVQCGFESRPVYDTSKIRC